MSEASIENARLLAYKNGSRTMDKLRIWRIGSLAASLPSPYDTDDSKSFREDSRVVVKSQGRQISVSMNEVDSTSDGLITTETSIDIEYETKRPRKVAGISAETTLTEDIAQEYGIAPVSRHFELDDASSTLSLTEVRRKLNVAKELINAAQIAELCEDGHLPLLMTGPM